MTDRLDKRVYRDTRAYGVCAHDWGGRTRGPGRGGGVGGRLGSPYHLYGGADESSPTCTAVPRYRGIGWAMVAYGIKLSVEARFNGDVTLDAKTSEFARHYERELAKQELRAQLIRGFFDSKVSP